MVKRDVGPEEFLLVDCLARSAGPHLRRPIGGDDDERRRALEGLHDRRQVIGRSRAARADEHHRLPVLLGEAQGEETGGALIEDGNRLDSRVPGEGDRERGRARPGREHGLGEALPHQGVDEDRAPQGVRVAGIQGGDVHWERRASSMALNFSSVSANSFSGEDPATIPAPAYRRARGPSTSAERRPTKKLPSPRESSQPIAPA